jgi:hypothetical protein
MKKAKWNSRYYCAILAALFIAAGLFTVPVMAEEQPAPQDPAAGQEQPAVQPDEAPAAPEENPQPEPLPQQPMPEPLPQQPMPQPMAQQPMPQPMPQQPMPQPMPQQPMPQPMPQQPMPQPMPQQPMPQYPQYPQQPQYPQYPPQTFSLDGVWGAYLQAGQQYVMQIQGNQYQSWINGMPSESGVFQIQGNLMSGQNHMGQYFTHYFQMYPGGMAFTIMNQETGMSLTLQRIQ